MNYKCTFLFFIIESETKRNDLYGDMTEYIDSLDNSDETNNTFVPFVLPYMSYYHRHMILFSFPVGVFFISDLYGFSPGFFP